MNATSLPYIRSFQRYGVGLFCVKYEFETDVLSLFSEGGGSVDADYYRGFPEVAEHLREYSNFWFSHRCPKEVFERFKKDLLRLGEEEHNGEAYTILYCLDSSKRLKYAERAAELGVARGMTAAAIFSLLNHDDLEAARHYLEMAAAAGDDYGSLLMGINLEFGMLSMPDFDRAARFYSVVKNPENRFIAQNNLGVLLAASGYLRSARKCFEESIRLLHIDDFPKGLASGRERTFEENRDLCDELLALPPEERTARTAVEQSGYSFGFDSIFFRNRQEPVIYAKTDMEAMKKLRDYRLTNVDGFDIDPADLADVRAQKAVAPKEPEKLASDFYFSGSRVYSSAKIPDMPAEMFFWFECKPHLGANTYIQRHYVELKMAFEAAGFQFVYLPAGNRDMKENDLIFKPEYGFTLSSEYQNFGYQTLLDGFADSLPPNVAGFLHCLPAQKADAAPKFIPPAHSSEKQGSRLYRFMLKLGFFKKREAKRKQEREQARIRKVFAAEAPKTRKWEFLIFPSAPQTDWARAFSAFIDYLKQHRANSSQASAPQVIESRLADGCRLTIDKSGRISVFDKQGLELAEVPMPTLSKVLYFCFLRHPEGIALKCLVDHRNELLQYYQALSPAKWDEKNIERLIDPTDNSANEKLSRIRKAFKEALPAFSDVELLIPHGQRGEVIRVDWPRDRLHFAFAENGTTPPLKNICPPDI